MRRIGFLSLLAMLLFFSANLLAQEKQVQGRITGAEDGEPIPGASVVEQGTTNGTISDMDGNYTLTVPVGATLVFQFVGMQEESVTVGEAGRYDVVMSVMAEELDEVMVIGYGTRKKRDIIGSVSSVNSEELSRMQTTTFTDALQGKATGVQITASSGVPGAGTNVLIRGNSSLKLNTSPLWIVDGVPIYSGSGLEETKGSTSQSITTE